nr:IS200/IS605 family transposase [Aphanothece sacrum]
MSSNLRKERHSVSDLKIHLICVTKYRRKVFTEIALIEKSFKEVASKMNFKVLEFNGESDHVHVLIEYPPKLSIVKFQDYYGLRCYLYFNTTRVDGKTLSVKFLFLNIRTT